MHVSRPFIRVLVMRRQRFLAAAIQVVFTSLVSALLVVMSISRAFDQNDRSLLLCTLQPCQCPTASTSPDSAVRRVKTDVDVTTATHSVDDQFVVGDDIFVNTSRTEVNQLRFNYVINNPNLCASAGTAGVDKNSSETLLLLNYVHTAVHHFGQRDRIRRTWANENLYNFRLGSVIADSGRQQLTVSVRTVFVLGRSVRMPFLQPAIEAEARRYNDIVQADFDDTYRNLTYKALAALKWITTYCRHAAYLLKVDDDAFVNTFGLASYLRRQHATGNRKRLLQCNAFHRAKIVRDKQGVNAKWAVSDDELKVSAGGKKPVVYPTYCAGLAYVISGDVVRALYRVSKYVPFFWIDDVYVTGQLIEALDGQVNITNWKAVYCDERLAERVFGDRQAWSRFMFAHVHGGEKYERAWQKLLRNAAAAEESSSSARSSARRSSARSSARSSSTTPTKRVR